MVDIHDLLRAAASESVYLQWADEDDLIVGFLSCQHLADSEVTLFYRLYGTRNVQRGTGTIQVEIRRKRGGKYWNKPSFVCPNCGRDAVRLYYVRGSWACKRSHDLLSITQRLNPVNKSIYQVEMHDRLNQVESKSARDLKKIERRKEKIGAAVSLLAQETRDRLPDHLQYRMFGTWLKAGDRPAKPDLRGIGYGWEPGMTGQLPGLESEPDPIPLSAEERETAEMSVEQLIERAQARAGLASGSGTGPTRSFEQSPLTSPAPGSGFPIEVKMPDIDEIMRRLGPLFK